MTESTSQAAFWGQVSVGETNYKEQEGILWGKRNILYLDYDCWWLHEYTYLSKLTELYIFVDFIVYKSS